MHDNKGRKTRWNVYPLILCGLVFFVITATIFCMVVNSREAKKEARREQIKAEQQAAAEEQKKKAEEVKAQEEEDRKESSKVRPGTPVGTMDPQDGEKVVYLTFDDGPSKNTQPILDILEQYGAKATFFITGGHEDCRPLIKKAYEAGHTIGLHTYSHDYATVYSSVEAYFDDLEKIGEVAKEQIGYVPCFIRFPGGASNTVSAKYTSGIMTELTRLVQEKGYQYYDWNVSSGDGDVCSADEIVQNSTTDQYDHVMILFHDAATKDTTVEALPRVIEYYKNLGYEFRAIDRESFVSHHKTNN